MRDILEAIKKTGLGSIIAVILGVITSKTLAVTLGPQGLGLYSVLNQIQLTVIGLATLGGSTALVQGIASRSGLERKRYIITTIWIFGAGAIIALSIVLLNAPVIANLFTSDHAGQLPAVLLRWLALPIGLGILYTYTSSLLNGLRAIGWLALSKIIGAAGTALLVYPLAQVIDKSDQTGLIWLFVAGMGLPLLANLLYLWRTRPFSGGAKAGWQPDWALAGQFLKIASVILVVGQVGNLAFLLINHMVIQHHGLSGLGIFTAAWSLSMQYVMLVVTSFNTYYLPTLSGIHDEGQRAALVENIGRLTLIGITPLIMAVIVLKPLIVTTLYSNEFLPSIQVIQWMVPGDYIKISAFVVAMPILAYADMKVFFWTELAWHLGFLGLSALWLKMTASLEGIGMIFALLYVCYLIFYLRYNVRKYRFRFSARTATMWIIGLGLITAVSLSTYNTTTVHWGGATSWIGAGIFFSVCVLTAPERRSLLAALVRRAGRRS